ncbi:MAG: YidC/Oxa1 family membrane protein insertase [Actinomycetota bacterium]|nr:YidC/Oxa1 family membrane protein insertase [Actinomycetota bacterium]
MFDGLFEVTANTLSFFYDLVPNYAVAIALLTLVVMVVTTPFTLKGTRSMIQMQRLQPELRKLQLKHKDDRQKLNEEMMALYQENKINPLGGCLPLLLQAPIFFILFQVVQGLTRVGEDGTFNPKHLDDTSKLFTKLDGAEKMMAFGVDLAESASKSLGEGFGHGFPHVVLVAIVAVTSYYQQKQIQGRNPNAEVPPQQKMLMRLMPAMFVVFAFVAPSALVIYFVTSNLYRIGMQAYITRTLYHGEDSLGKQAQLAAAESKKLREEHGAPEIMPKLRRRDKDAATATTGGSAITASSTGANASSGDTQPRPTPPKARTNAPNRSKKKKKKRR